MSIARTFRGLLEPRFLIRMAVALCCLLPPLAAVAQPAIAEAEDQTLPAGGEPCSESVGCGGGFMCLKLICTDPAVACEANDVKGCEALCTSGLADGCSLLAAIYENGTGVAQDYAKAVAFYEKACELRSVWDCYYVGYLYNVGTSVPQDFAKALAYFQQACDEGSADGCASLGGMYVLGTGVAEDFAKAGELYQKACDGGNADGCAMLGTLVDIRKGAATDDVKAFELYQKACNDGSTNGCFNLGTLYNTGRGVARDDTKASEWFQKACDGGSADGCSNLGTLYNTGAGVAQDYAKAAELYQKTCDQGSAAGCSNLGGLLMSGVGLSGDYATVVELYQKACDAGDAESCSVGKTLTGPVEPMKKAVDGQTVADCYAKSAALDDSAVTVRGKVVKLSANVMGKNWVYLQDGTGDAASNTQDLTVNTTAVVKLGGVVTMRGTLRKDKDYGSGQVYPVILEDAALVE